MTTIREILSDQPNRPSTLNSSVISIRVKNAAERRVVEEWFAAKVLETVRGTVADADPRFVTDTGKGRING